MIQIALMIVFILLLTIAIGTPIAFALGSTAIISALLFMPSGQLIQFGEIVLNNSMTGTQLIIPMFVLMAEALARGGIAKDIYSLANRVFKNFRSGLAISAMIASTIFAALSGSSPATAAAIGRISIKEMIEKGYREDFAVGTVVTGGTLGVMIPPSISLVIYGILTETSIVKLLMAGILPGILLSFMLCLFIVYRVRTNPSLVKDPVVNNNTELNKAEKEKAGVKLVILPIILIILIIIFLYTGIATPTEIAGFGAVGSLLIIFIMKRFNKEFISKTFPAAAKTSVMILLLVICGYCLSYVISYLGLAREISNVIINTGLNRWWILILVYLLWIVLGCLMDPGSMVVLTIPFIFTTLMDLGFNPIWLGVTSTFCIQIGMITPPVGLNLFVVKSVTDIGMDKIIKGAFPYIFVLLLCLAIITLFPQIALFIPSMM